jgi:hypothetical protein
VGRLAQGGSRELTVGMDILTDRHQVTRLEIVETGRRRRWSDAEKLRIVEESLSGPRLASATARRLLKSHSSERVFSLGRKFMGSVEIRARLTNEPLALQVLHQCIDRGARNIKCLSYSMRPGRPVLSKMRQHQPYSI